MSFFDFKVFFFCEVLGVELQSGIRERVAEGRAVEDKFSIVGKRAVVDGTWVLLGGVIIVEGQALVDGGWVRVDGVSVVEGLVLWDGVVILEEQSWVDGATVVEKWVLRDGVAIVGERMLWAVAVDVGRMV